MRPDPRVGSELGPYRIEAVIGRGGMGVVYLATHTGLDRKVALKLLTPDYADDDAFRARFLRESKLAASIDHPNIIPIYEAGQIDGTFFLAMRYVEGIDLQQRLVSGPLDPRYATTIVAQVASALDAAHRAGLVHRDVKPGNVLLAPSQALDGSDHVYLTDFGLTKQRGSQSDLTQIGGFVGTLDYIAPEQIEGKAVDGRADQYALAAVAVACLTGGPPFPRDSDVAIINAHLHDAPPALHDRRPELAVGIDAVIARGLAKKPDDRYPDCKAFVDDLRTALGVTDTQTRPPNARIPDRRPLIIVGSLVLIGLLGIGFGLASTGGKPPIASPSADLAASSPSASVEPSPTEDVFPNSDEASLIGGLPENLKKDCVRGPYDAVQAEQRKPGTPLASVTCSPGIASGASAVVIRTFHETHGASLSGDFNTESVVSNIEASRGIRPGSCATAATAADRWMLNSVDAGAMVCYIDSTTGDAILYWSYKDSALLIKATNQKGDFKALYGFFNDVARFIQP
jgi:serine/threonine-protein kinase